jgi:hypothetical protein
MYLKTVDGVVKFATHLFSISVDDNIKKEFYIYQIEPEGIICYSNTEATEVEFKLNNLGIQYSIQLQNIDPTIQAKVNNVQYTSCSEALDHITNDTEPESHVIPNIKSNINLIQQGVNIDVNQIDKEQKIKARIDSGEITAANFDSLSTDEQATVKLVLFKNYSPTNQDIAKALSACEFLLVPIVKMLGIALDRTKLTSQQSAYLDALVTIVNQNTMPIDDTTDWRYQYLQQQFTQVQNNRAAYFTIKQNVTGSV